MRPVIGFAGNGHLQEHSFAAAHKKGFKCTKYIPGRTGDSVEDLRQCDIVYICPDRPSNTSPEDMVDLVLPHLNPDAVLVIFCQVEPGFTRKVKWPQHQLYYQIETLRIKDAEERALRPERIIVGSYNGYIGHAKYLHFLESFNCRIITMSYESAELAKIAINIYLASQVSTTNTLAEIAEKVGADWKEIISALQTDKRIGKEAYLEPGYGLSQHLMRDLETIHKIGGNTDVTDSFLEHSEYRKALNGLDK